MNTRETLTVVICAYTLDRWDDLTAAVASVHAQHRPAEEVLLVIDHNPELAVRARELTGTRIVANAGPRGLSGARNTGVAAARGEVVGFLDDDAAAEPDWTTRLLAGYREDAVLGVGGLVTARWDGGRPDWFPPEFDWVVGCTYRGSPRREAAVRNLTGANMSFRRTALDDAGGFRSDLGRVGTRPLGCEETEICLRLTRRHPGGRLHYDPAAVVRHHVPPTRATWAYFRARCYAEGRSKAQVARYAGAGPALADERGYLRRTLPAAFWHDLRHARLRRAAALCAGTALTVLGYAAGTLRGLPARTATDQGRQP
ncbi:glycosyltransferase family 2 protein [Kitasatospora sp. NPDC049285]|uniref:glycosyltransferase family 2 protein n=1 Tax=Kitasatospora sp. NPDC049285 TaxID=3157096 RepID=UPI0034434774